MLRCACIALVGIVNGKSGCAESASAGDYWRFQSLECPAGETGAGLSEPGAIGTAGTLSVDYSQTSGAFPPMWRNLSVPGHTNGSQMDQAIRNLGIKYERMFYEPALWSCGPGCYDFTAPRGEDGGWGDDNLINMILDQGAVPVLSIGYIPGWLGANVNGPPTDYDAYTQMWTDALHHVAVTYPNITYLEAFNEPDIGGISSTDVNNMYAALVSSVQSVNATLGSKRFLVGGPAAASLSSGVLRDFLSHVLSDGLQLDFISWHSYDGDLGGGADQVRGILWWAGADPNLPQLVTEWGTNGCCPQAWSNVTSASDAVFVVGGWHSVLIKGLGNIVQPYFFSPLNCYLGDPNESLFVTGPIGGTPDGITCPGPDGAVMPVYNAFKMMSMQKADMVSYRGISDSRGLSPIASEDSTGVALMLASQDGGDVGVTMNNLPAAFGQKPFAFQEYLIDPTHSNYAYDPSSHGTLQMVQGAMEPANTSFKTTVFMAANSIVLIVLTPGD